MLVNLQNVGDAAFTGPSANISHILISSLATQAALQAALHLLRVGALWCQLHITLFMPACHVTG